MRRRLCLALAAGGLALLAGCGQPNVNPNITYKPKYAQSRVLMLLPDAASLGAYVSVAGDLPTDFNLAAATQGITPFQQTVIGAWTLYVSKNEATLGSLAEMMPNPGGSYTAVVAPTTAMGSSGPLAETWTTENFAPSTSQAQVRFVSGLPGLSDATVQIGGMSLTGPFDPATLSGWQAVDPGTVKVTITPASSAALVFQGITVAAGDLRTFALAGGSNPTTAQLLDFNDSTATYGATPAAPMVQSHTPMN